MQARVLAPAQIVTEHATVGPVQPLLKRELQAALQLVAVGEIPVEVPRERLAHRRVAIAGHEPPHRGLLEDVVTQQELVRALARDYDLETAIAHAFREQVHRNRPCTELRRLGMIHDVRHRCGKHLAVACEHVMLRSQVLGGEQLIGALIVIGVVERDGEGMEIVGIFPGQRGRHRGIEATTQVRANRNVCQQSKSHGIVKERVERLVGVRVAPVALGKVELPIPPKMHLAVATLDDGVVRRQKLSHTAKRCTTWRQCPEHPYGSQVQRIGLWCYFGYLKEGLHLGGEVEPVADEGIEEWADPHAVATEHEAVLPAVIEDEGILPVEELERLRPTILIEMD